MKNQKYTFSRSKLIFVYLFSRIKPLQFLLPRRLKDEWIVNWNNHMFWTAFKSGGSTFFFDYYCELKKPASYSPKIKVADEYKLTKEDVQHFYENGYLKPFRIMSPEKANEVSEHLVHVATKVKSKIFDPDKYQFTSEAKSKGTFKFPEKYKEYIKDELNKNHRHLEDRVLLDLFKHPAIVERCAQLLGENLLVWRSNFFSVPPKTKGTDWHQASTWLHHTLKEPILYPPDLKELFQITAWIALTDTHKEKACLKILRDSQWKMHPITFKFNATGKTSFTYGKYDYKLDYDILPENVHYLEMKAGECLIFSERALHGSTDNQTDEWRWGVNARYVGTDTRIYTDKMLKKGGGVKVYDLQNVSLDKWKAVLVRGQDQYGYNRLLKEEEMPV